MSALFPVVSPDIGFCSAAVSDFTILILESPALLYYGNRTVWRSSMPEEVAPVGAHIFPGPVSRSNSDAKYGCTHLDEVPETGFIFSYRRCPRALI